VTLVKLSPYDQVTVWMWEKAHRIVTARPPHGFLGEAAVHVVLAGLRACPDRRALVQWYERDPANDFSLISSLLGIPNDDTNELLWRIRNAAFHRRWAELGEDRQG